MSAGVSREGRLIIRHGSLRVLQRSLEVLRLRLRLRLAVVENALRQARAIGHFAIPRFARLGKVLQGVCGPRRDRLRGAYVVVERKVVGSLLGGLLEFAEGFVISLGAVVRNRLVVQPAR